MKVFWSFSWSYKNEKKSSQWYLSKCNHHFVTLKWKRWSVSNFRAHRNFLKPTNLHYYFKTNIKSYQFKTNNFPCFSSFPFYIGLLYSFIPPHPHSQHIPPGFFCSGSDHCSQRGSIFCEVVSSTVVCNSLWQMFHGSTHNTNYVSHANTHRNVSLKYTHCHTSICMQLNVCAQLLYANLFMVSPIGALVCCA